MKESIVTKEQYEEAVQIAQRYIKQGVIKFRQAMEDMNKNPIPHTWATRSTPLENLLLDVRLLNVLYKNIDYFGVKKNEKFSVGHLENLSKTNLYLFKGMGNKTMRDFRDLLDEFEIKLK